MPSEASTTRSESRAGITSRSSASTHRARPVPWPGAAASGHTMRADENLAFVCTIGLSGGRDDGAELVTIGGVRVHANGHEALLHVALAAQHDERSGARAVECLG